MLNKLWNLSRGYVREYYQHLYWLLKLRGIEHQFPILVYQMGKVGSSTVVNTLHGLGLSIPILHVHTLNPDHLKHAIRRQRMSQRPYLHEHLIISGILIKKLQRAPFRCRIITLTREPVVRAISFIFEDHVKQIQKSESDILPADAQLALDNLLSAENGVSDPTRWFDRELKFIFGVDVFSIAYDYERGFSLLHGADVNTLIIRVEDLDRSLGLALGHFFGIDGSEILIKKSNESTKKSYAHVIQFIKQTYYISPATAEYIFNTKYFKHFYALDEDKISSRWLRS